MKRFQGAFRISLPFLRHKTDDLSSLRKELQDVKKRIAAIEETQSIQALVEFYASRPQHKLNNLEDIIYYCSKANYNYDVFCHMELPVLLSRLIMSIHTLPCGLNVMPSVALVRNTYLNSFKKLVNCDFPDSKESITSFRRVVEEIEEAHSRRNILVTMAMGLLELKDLLSRHRQYILSQKKAPENSALDYYFYEALAELTKPMDNFSLGMVNYNFLSRMFLSLEENDDKMIGMVDLEIDLEKVVRNAVDDAKQVCIEHYGDCPDVKFIISKDSDTLKFSHMSSTITYIVVEIMKNALRATVESHMQRNSVGIVDCDNMPAVEVLVNIKQSARHACICISDEGLGMTRAQCKMAMTYAYTSVKRPLLQLHDNDDNYKMGSNVAPLAGFGFGLPMSKVYARAFDGDLVMTSMEGYGTRVCYYIKL